MTVIAVEQESRPLTLSQKRFKARLASKIAAIVKTRPDDLEFGFVFARGYWTHAHADVMQITGYVKVKDAGTFSIGSWESMTKCLRHGFTVLDQRKKDRPYADFTIEAIPYDDSNDWYSESQLQEIAAQKAAQDETGGTVTDNAVEQIG